MRTAIGSIALTALVIIAGGCTSGPTPKTPEKRQSLVAEADAGLQTMIAKDPSLRDLINRSPGYAIFPDIGKAGAVVGGAYGRGVLYEQGRPTGYAELKQGSIGLQLGAETYSELVVFENDAALGRLKSGDFDIGGEASAVALKAGTGGAASFQGGVAVFTMTKGGLMAAANIRGQKINYQAMDQATQDATGTAGNRSSTRSTTGPSAEMQLRTDSGAASGSVSTDAQTATERTEQRIEQRRDAAQDSATGTQR
jgi:lipid-binding SYLF domain-containing protein